MSQRSASSVVAMNEYCLRQTPSSSVASVLTRAVLPTPGGPCSRMRGGLEGEFRFGRSNADVTSMCSLPSSSSRPTRFRGLEYINRESRLLFSASSDASVTLAK